MGISHINKDGNAVMIDVSNKSITLRTAVAKTTIKMKSDTLSRIYSFDIKKGDVLGVAQVAGIMGAKKTSDIIPMCHPLLLTGIDIKFDKSDEMIAERRQGTGKMPDDMPKWMALTITKIDLASKWIGNVVCWITIPLIFAMVYEVLARKLFTAPTMWAYDMSRFLYGALFMLGAGYALSKGVHIRADFLYRNFKTKTQGRIDFWLYLLFGWLFLMQIHGSSTTI